MRLRLVEGQPVQEPLELTQRNRLGCRRFTGGHWMRPRSSRR